MNSVTLHMPYVICAQMATLGNKHQEGQNISQSSIRVIDCSSPSNQTKLKRYYIV